MCVCLGDSAIGRAGWGEAAESRAADGAGRELCWDTMGLSWVGRHFGRRAAWLREGLAIASYQKNLPVNVHTGKLISIQENEQWLILKGRKKLNLQQSIFSGFSHLTELWFLKSPTKDDPLETITSVTRVREKCKQIPLF